MIVFSIVNDEFYVSFGQGFIADSTPFRMEQSVTFFIVVVTFVLVD